LYFYNARYYNPVLGRFLSPDSIVPKPGNPQSLNRYSYVENNPVNRIDPSGHFSFGKFFRSLGRALPAIVAGIVVGVVTGGLGAPAVLAGMLAGATTGAVNTAINGGNWAQNILVGAVFGGVGGAVAGPLFGALGGNTAAGFTVGNFAAAVGTGAILGGAFGGISAAMAGGNIGEGILGGALGGAMVAAAAYGGAYAWHRIETSPAIARPGEGVAEALQGQSRDYRGPDITDQPFIQNAIERYQAFTGEDLSALRVHHGGTAADGYSAIALDANTVVLNQKFFAYEIGQQYVTLDHEFWHITQMRTTPDFGSRYFGNRFFFEVDAERAGAAFATHILGKPVPMHPNFRQ
jgi:hypothetical protein